MGSSRIVNIGRPIDPDPWKPAARRRDKRWSQWDKRQTAIRNTANKSRPHNIGGVELIENINAQHIKVSLWNLNDMQPWLPQNFPGKYGGLPTFPTLAGPAYLPMPACSGAKFLALAGPMYTCTCAALGGGGVLYASFGHCFMETGGRFKHIYELLNLRCLKILTCE